MQLQAAGPGPRMDELDKSMQEGDFAKHKQDRAGLLEGPGTTARGDGRTEQNRERERPRKPRRRLRSSPRSSVGKGPEQESFQKKLVGTGGMSKEQAKQATPATEALKKRWKTSKNMSDAPKQE